MRSSKLRKLGGPICQNHVKKKLEIHSIPEGLGPGGRLPRAGLARAGLLGWLVAKPCMRRPGMQIPSLSWVEDFVPPTASNTIDGPQTCPKPVPPNVISNFVFRNYVNPSINRTLPYHKTLHMDRTRQMNMIRSKPQ
jgi:hypothetical protein